MGLLGTLSFLLRHPLSQGRKLATLRRYAGWQIGARLVPGPVACEFANGAYLLARPGMTGATGNVYVGLHEFEEMAFVLHFLRAGDLFVDVGANIGSYSLLATAGAKAECIAFEPGAAAFAWLERNVLLNGVGARTELHQRAVGGRVGTVALTRDGDTLNRVVTDPVADALPTDSVSLTTLDAALAGRVPILAKIDVEGFETEVLNGATETLAAPALRALLLEVNGSGRRYGYSDADLRRHLEAMGFAECAYRPFERRLVPRREGRPDAPNTLFVRDRAFVEARLRNAALIEVHGWCI
jgi:FkbM family methyltransferase